MGHIPGQNLYEEMSSGIPFRDVAVGRRKGVLKGGKERMGEVVFYTHTLRKNTSC